jgi:hypothetical protein
MKKSCTVKPSIGSRSCGIVTKYQALSPRPAATTGSAAPGSTDGETATKKKASIEISQSGVWRILKRLDMNRLPANQRYKPHAKRWKRNEKQQPGHRVQVDVKLITPFEGARKPRNAPHILNQAPTGLFGQRLDCLRTAETATTQIHAAEARSA